MAWIIEISKTAVKQLKKLDKTDQQKIFRFLYLRLQHIENPRSFGKALKGNKKNLWRYRVGDFRLICDINNKKIYIAVLALGHRKTIYKNNA